MKHFYNQHYNAVKNSLNRIFKQPVTSFLILIMLAIALALPLTLYLSVQSFQLVLDKLTIEPSITVFLDNQTPEEQVTATEITLKNNSDISHVEFISKQQALTETAKAIGQKDILSTLGENPLPDAFIVTPASAEPSHVENLTNQLNQLPYVNQVVIDSKWVQTLYYIKSFMIKVLIFLSLTLSFAFILIAHNTIRLQILSYREEIEVSHLLGASASFIRRPFLYQAFWQAIFTLILGITISTVTIITAIKQTQNIFSPYGIELQWRLFSFTELIVITFIIVALALLGASLATWQFLKEFRNQA